MLRDEGLVDSRQGFGWFVAADPVRQTLGRLGTIESQLAAEGVHSERRVLDFRFVAAPARVRRLLGADTVLRVRRLNLADGEPFALVTVWCPEGYGAELSRADVERSPFYELLDVELGGATQTHRRGRGLGHDAELLGVPVGSPVLRCERITRRSRASRCWSASTSSRPTSPSSSSTCPTSRRRSRRAACAWSSDRAGPAQRPVPVVANGDRPVAVR